jgi:malyl-CoA/(S)-citramalyl-CoA lyase
VISALNDYEWYGCSVSLRINDLDTPFCYRDIIGVVEQAGDKLDTVLSLKVGDPSDILFVVRLLE